MREAGSSDELGNTACYVHSVCGHKEPWRSRWAPSQGTVDASLPHSSPAVGGSALLNSSRQAVSRKRVLYLLSTEARYLARG